VSLISNTIRFTIVLLTSSISSSNVFTPKAPIYDISFTIIILYYIYGLIEKERKKEKERKEEMKGMKGMKAKSKTPRNKEPI
jgi:hypothetical protein